MQKSCEAITKRSFLCKLAGLVALPWCYNKSEALDIDEMTKWLYALKRAREAIHVFSAYPVLDGDKVGSWIFVQRDELGRFQSQSPVENPDLRQAAVALAKQHGIEPGQIVLQYETPVAIFRYHLNSIQFISA